MPRRVKTEKPADAEQPLDHTVWEQELAELDKVVQRIAAMSGCPELVAVAREHSGKQGSLPTRKSMAEPTVFTATALPQASVVTPSHAPRRFLRFPAFHSRTSQPATDAEMADLIITLSSLDEDDQRLEAIQYYLQQKERATIGGVLKQLVRGEHLDRAAAERLKRTLREREGRASFWGRRLADGGPQRPVVGHGADDRRDEPLRRASGSAGGVALSAGGNEDPFASAAGTRARQDTAQRYPRQPVADTAQRYPRRPLVDTTQRYPRQPLRQPLHSQEPSKIFVPGRWWWAGICSSEEMANSAGDMPEEYEHGGALPQGEPQGEMRLVHHSHPRLPGWAWVPEHYKERALLTLSDATWRPPRAVEPSRAIDPSRRAHWDMIDARRRSTVLRSSSSLQGRDPAEWDPEVGGWVDPELGW